VSRLTHIDADGRARMVDVSTKPATAREALTKAGLKASDIAALDALRLRYLGRKDGLLTARLKGLGTLEAAERPAAGALINAAKDAVEAALTARLAALRARTDDDLGAERIDLTLPPRPIRLGRLHPITATMREVSRIFATMGFETVEGPEIEWDSYNFEALNIPKGHPARDKFNSLWISNPLGDLADRPMLLRTHTSPMQIRVMETRQPPVRVIIPGRSDRRVSRERLLPVRRSRDR